LETNVERFYMQRMNDYQDLNNVKFFLLDMDGTVYLEDHLLPGAQDFLSLLTDRKIEYIFLTNNSSKDATQYIEKLALLGIQSTPDMILTSGKATADFLLKKHKGASLYVVGTPALQKEFTSLGFSINEYDPDIVVLGFDTTLTYDKLWKCCNFIREGRPYIATHPDINCPTKGGFMPDIGSFIALIQASTGREPDWIIGKPYEAMVEAIELRTGFKRDEICMIGDRLYTDIALGAFGIKTILVLSGETKKEDIPMAKIQPDYVMEDLSEVRKILREK